MWSFHCSTRPLLGLASTAQKRRRTDETGLLLSPGGAVERAREFAGWCHCLGRSLDARRTALDVVRPPGGPAQPGLAAARWCSANPRPGAHCRPHRKTSKVSCTTAVAADTALQMHPPSVTAAAVRVSMEARNTCRHFLSSRSRQGMHASAAVWGTQLLRAAPPP